MSFESEYASLIWDSLYSVSIPDTATQDIEYLKRFGVHVTGVRAIDDMTANNTVMVRIPIIDIVNYYSDGIPVIIHSRQDMLRMREDITKYLGEWEYHIKHDLNLGTIPDKLLQSLDNFCKYVYGKATAGEVVANKIANMRIGLKSRIDMAPKGDTEVTKPNYEGIGKLVRQRTRRF